MAGKVSRHIWRCEASLCPHPVPSLPAVAPPPLSVDGKHGAAASSKFFCVYLVLWILGLSFYLSASQKLSLTPVYADHAPKTGAINPLYFPWSAGQLHLLVTQSASILC